MQRIAGASGSHGGSWVASRRRGASHLHEPDGAPSPPPADPLLGGSDTPILAAEAAGRTRSRLAAYVALTKPRIIELLLVTTVPTMIVAQQGLPPLWLMVATVAGGTLAAGGANAINMYVDRDIDRLMRRTVGRPLVTGEIAPPAALSFAVALEVLAFVWLWAVVNLLSAVLGLAACLFYVFVYTMWLKRSSASTGTAPAAPPMTMLLADERFNHIV